MIALTDLTRTARFAYLGIDRAMPQRRLPVAPSFLLPFVLGVLVGLILMVAI